MKLTIERERWSRGVREHFRLKNPDGTMCCLGFLGELCGVRQDLLKTDGIPRQEYSPDWPGWLFDELPGDYGSSHRLYKMTMANDDTKISEEEREARVSAAFAEVGVEVEFV